MSHLFSDYVITIFFQFLEEPEKSLIIRASIAKSIQLAAMYATNLLNIQSPSLRMAARQVGCFGRAYGSIHTRSNWVNIRSATWHLIIWYIHLKTVGFGFLIHRRISNRLFISLSYQIATNVQNSLHIFLFFWNILTSLPPSDQQIPPKSHFTFYEKLPPQTKLPARKILGTSRKCSA